MNAEQARGRLFVALDVPNAEEAEVLVDALAKEAGGFKIGMELITAIGAPAAVKIAGKYGNRVFYDHKFYDIPNSVAGAAKGATSHGVFMLTVPMATGEKAVHAAVQAVASVGPTMVLGVTVLTSFDDADVMKIHGAAVDATVRKFAAMAQSAGCHGIVCSPRELPILQNLEWLRDMVFVVLGIRPTGSDRGDQKRFMTPYDVAKAGADYLVIGRPITQAPDPVAAARAIVSEMAEGFSTRGM